MIFYSMTNQMEQLIHFFLKNAYCLLDFICSWLCDIHFNNDYNIKASTLESHAEI